MSKNIREKGKGDKMRKLFLVCGSIIFLFIGLRFYVTPFFSLKNHTCSAGYLISDEYSATISQYISDNEHRYHSLQDYVVDIKKMFPVIKSIEICLRATGNVVTIQPYDPMCSINDQFIFTSHNQLLPKNYFSLSAQEMIPVVSVAHNLIDNNLCFLTDIFNALPPSFNTFYNLDCIKGHDIRFIDKNNPQFVIVSDSAQKNYQVILQQCEHIKKSLSDRGAFERGMQWIADARFARYIIAYKA